MASGASSSSQKIPLRAQEHTRTRILTYAQTHYAGKFSRIEVRFRGVFCYIDAWTDPADQEPLHLCRLRYTGHPDRWGFDFYTYSGERYERSIFPSGDFVGPPEEAFAASAGYLG